MGTQHLLGLREPGGSAFATDDAEALRTVDNASTVEREGVYTERND